MPRNENLGALRGLLEIEFPPLERVTEDSLLAEVRGILPPPKV